MNWELADTGLLALRVARGLDLLTALALFGALFFAADIAWPGLRSAPALRQRLLRLLRAALAFQFIAAAAWLLAQAHQAGGSGLWHTFLVVSGSTLFGKTVLLRAGLLALAVWLAGPLIMRWRLLAALLPAALALALQARLGHAAAAPDWQLPALLALHALAAGAWLGGLLPLAWLLAEYRGAALRQAVRRFSRIAQWAVLALAATAALMGAQLAGGLGGWFGTAYGITALGKVLGLALLLAFAAWNRFVLTPRLNSGADARSLRRSIFLETLAGLLVVVLAVLLATLPPGAHVQPEWPFAIQPDPRAWERPWVPGEFKKLVSQLIVAALGIAALFWRPTRLAGPALALALLWWLPAPNLKHFVQPAHAGSFYRSPTGYTASSIARGEDLVRQHCVAACFGSQNDPTDLTPYNIWQRSDGDFFEWLARIFDRIGHSPFPHGVIAGLSERQRWQLIDYFRARVAGQAVRQTDRWPYAVPPPATPLVCHDDKARSLADLRGRLVHVAATDSPHAPQPAQLPNPPSLAGVRLTTVFLYDQDIQTPPLPGTCHATEPDAWTAFAIAGWRSPQTLAGTAFLIDPQGWLRLRMLPEETREKDAGLLEQDIRFILENPLPAGTAGHRH